MQNVFTNVDAPDDALVDRPAEPSGRGPRVSGAGAARPSVSVRTRVRLRTRPSTQGDPRARARHRPRPDPLRSGHGRRRARAASRSCSRSTCSAPRRRRRPGSAWPRSRRTFEEWVQRYRPSAVAVERVFAQHNVGTVMGTAQAAGVALLVAARHGIPAALHTPERGQGRHHRVGPRGQGPGRRHGGPHPPADRGAQAGRRRRRARAGHLPRLARAAAPTGSTRPRPRVGVAARQQRAYAGRAQPGPARGTARPDPRTSVREEHADDAASDRPGQRERGRARPHVRRRRDRWGRPARALQPRAPSPACASGSAPPCSPRWWSARTR